MTNDNNTPIDFTTTPLNVAATDATVTTVGNITASTAAATTSTILPAGNAVDETTRRSLFGAGLYQKGERKSLHARAAAVVQLGSARLGLGSWVLVEGLLPNKNILFGPIRLSGFYSNITRLLLQHKMLSMVEEGKGYWVEWRQGE
ncbi:hypothetical protein DY000_02038922 [Brassica cretica]|uniref:Uncharacterized protein n=1 Tax=Brassica cretica TaxID=69181 RepID=A0ABQ7BED3_BRACR|nr:hypothetical protein DY000_02038922 [Brassica cretica]